MSECGFTAKCTRNYWEQNTQGNLLKNSNVSPWGDFGRVSPWEQLFFKRFACAKTKMKSLKNIKENPLCQNTKELPNKK